MDIDWSMELRSGKYQGKSLDWVRRFDKRYFDWMSENRPEMIRSHKKPSSGKPSPWASGYKPSSPFRDSDLDTGSYTTTGKKSYGGGWSPYKSNEDKIRENFEKWSNPDAWGKRRFEEPPDTGMSRYDLRSPLSWGSPAAGGEISEGDSED